MPQIIYLAGMNDAARTAVIRLLAVRGYRVGAIVRHDYARLVDGTAQEYMIAGATCVSVISNGHFVTVLPERTPEETIQRLFADCHLVLAGCETPGCADIIEVVFSGGTLRYAGDRRLRAVIGRNVAGQDVVCFDHGMHDKVCDFIEERYLKPRLSTAVLAGGKSSRLGSNKAMIELNGAKLIEHVIHIVQHFTDTVRIIANDPETYRRFNVPVAADIKPGGGPLSGIHAALSLSTSDYVLILSCDMPLLETLHIKPLITAYPGHDITIYKHKKFEPLCAVYRRTCISALEELIEHGEYRIIDLFPTLNVKVIRADDPTPFTSINTREDYQRVKELRG